VLHSLDAFCAWLAATPLSQTIQTTDWIVPAVQTVHIIAVAAVMSSVLMIDLRLIGLGARDQSIAAVARRFLPFIWWPLPILLLSGATLIIAEPARSLQNPVFLLKMVLLVLAVAITLLCQLPLRKDAAFWELSAARRRVARLIALLSLPLWVCIIFAGRWIAYAQGT
jgi:uncharacterized membrane protein